MDIPLSYFQAIIFSRCQAIVRQSMKSSDNRQANNLTLISQLSDYIIVIISLIAQPVRLEAFSVLFWIWNENENTLWDLATFKKLLTMVVAIPAEQGW